MATPDPTKTAALIKPAEQINALLRYMAELQAAYPQSSALTQLKTKVEELSKGKLGVINLDVVKNTKIADTAFIPVALEALFGTPIQSMGSQILAEYEGLRIDKYIEGIYSVMQMASDGYTFLGYVIQTDEGTQLFDATLTPTTLFDNATHSEPSSWSAPKWLEVCHSLFPDIAQLQVALTETQTTANNAKTAAETAVSKAEEVSRLLKVNNATELPADGVPVANTSYKLGEISSLTLNGVPVSDYETTIYFTCGTGFSMTIPDCEIVGELAAEDGKSYVMSILNGIVVMGEVVTYNN